MMSTKKFLNLFFLSLILILGNAYAGDSSEIKKLIENIYKENEKALQCRDVEGAVDKSLIKVPAKYFSDDFMLHYRPICLGKGFVGFDIRSGENGIYLYKDSAATISNLHIGAPSITGDFAIVRTVYDLDQFSFKEWGNFTKFQLVRQGSGWRINDIELGGTGEERESITALKSIKSLKQYLSKSVDYKND